VLELLEKVRLLYKPHIYLYSCKFVIVLNYGVLLLFWQLICHKLDLLTFYILHILCLIYFFKAVISNISIVDMFLFGFKRKCCLLEQTENILISSLRHTFLN